MKGGKNITEQDADFWTGVVFVISVSLSFYTLTVFLTLDVDEAFIKTNCELNIALFLVLLPL